VFQWTGGSGWVQIGRPAGAIYAGAGLEGGLYATNPVNGDLMHYEEVTLGTNLIFKRNSDGSVYQWVGGDAWLRAGSSMATVIAT
jgi:hypothetical protein